MHKATFNILNDELVNQSASQRGWIGRSTGMCRYHGSVKFADVSQTQHF